MPMSQRLSFKDFKRTGSVKIAEHFLVLFLCLMWVVSKAKKDDKDYYYNGVNQ